MLDWETLLNPARRKERHEAKESIGTGVGRTELERDYDRVLFATPTRRLADKTQVFPMEENDSIRTRLTHSHEVSNLARSIGVRLAFETPTEVFGDSHEDLGVKRNIPALLAAVGLAHDLGNPPFGHQGEFAIQNWFRAHPRREEFASDFTGFDGNAQTFRLLARLQVLNDKFGLNLTYATLSALLKYPVIYGASNGYGMKKSGVFKSEEPIVREVWDETGLSEGVRHPAAYLMEACDDIAYSIIDAEDTVKKGYASFYDLMDSLESQANGDAIVEKVVEKARIKNSEFKNENGLSSGELNEISMQMFRVTAISEMVPAATDVFVENVSSMLNERCPPTFELIKQSRCETLCRLCKEFDKRYGFQHKDVLQLELQGNNYIQNMMTMLWSAIEKCPDEHNAFERYAFGGISENYRRVYDESQKDVYAKCQLLCDAVSGMTETHLIRKHDELKALRNEKK